MARCRIRFSIPGKIEIRVQAGEEEEIREFIEDLKAGEPTTWLEQMILNGLSWEDIEIDEVKFLGHIPEPGEPLVFD